MTEFQRLFLVQATSNFDVFEILRERETLPRCHALHYLQMAAEMIGKSHAWRTGPRTHTHRAFVIFLRTLSHNREAQGALGHGGKNSQWKYLLRKAIPLAEHIEDLAPALTPDGPNAEYPWPRQAPTTTPAEHRFSVWNELMGTPPGLQFLNLMKNLLASAESFL
jgi:hypothetical protein